MSGEHSDTTADAAAASLTEQAELEMRYDGPIPATALADLRACPSGRITYAHLRDEALTQWHALAFKSLKHMQQRLRATRRAPNRAYAVWCFRQCLNIRRACQSFAIETARRRVFLRIAPGSRVQESKAAT